MSLVISRPRPPSWNSKARTPAEQAWQVHASLASRSDRYSLLGWSEMGDDAIDLAAAMPGSVERLVLVATTPPVCRQRGLAAWYVRGHIGEAATQLRTNYKRTVSEFLELQVRGSAASERVLAELHASLFSHGEAHPKALVAGLNTLKSSDLRSMLGLVRAPTLVVAGQYDRVTLPAASRALAEALPDARYIEFRRAAHAPFLSHTPEFAALVTEFLRGGADAKPANGQTDAAGVKTGATLHDAISEETILTSVDAAGPNSAANVTKVVGAASAAVGTTAAGAVAAERRVSGRRRER